MPTELNDTQCITALLTWFKAHVYILSYS